jgi:hypothetical protein
MDVIQADIKPAASHPLKKRPIFYSLLAFNVSLMFFIIVPMILKAQRRVDVAPLPADEASVFSYLDNLYSGEFTEFPLRGLVGTRHMPLNVARGVALAPNSISVGLRRFNDLKPVSKTNFGHLLCAGADPDQIDEFCRRIASAEIDEAPAISFAHSMRLLMERRIPLRREWIDSLVSRKWNDGQAYELSFELRAVVSYPGWPGYGGTVPAERWPLILNEFKAWWTSHRSSIEALPGEPLHLKS